MISIIKNQTGTIRELLDSTSDVGIVIGANQNIDSIGAALGLYLVLEAAGKNAQVIAKDVPSVEVSNLVGVDKIAKSFEGSTKMLTISVPYREGEIEKVSYNIEGNKLNVNLFAEEAGISFSEQDVEYIRKGSSPRLVITIGVVSDEELASFVDPAAVKTIHLDNNPVNSLMGDVSIIDPTFSSISEIAAELIRELSLGADSDAFQNLMDGITYATRNFTNQATSAFAFEAAGFLLQNGARRKEKTISGGSNRQDRNFPRVDQFANAKSDRALSDNAGPQRGSGSNQGNPAKGWSATGGNQGNPAKGWSASGGNRPQRHSQAPWANSQDSQHAPKETTAEVRMADDVSDTSFTEGSLPEDIPDDWFLPKVFKGSKKGN